MRPHPGEEHARVVPVHREVTGAGSLVDEEHALPVLAAVGAPVDPALVVGRPQVALRRDVHAVWIERMDPDRRDVSRPGEADVGPGRAAVHRLVDAVAVRGRHAAHRSLAGPDVDDVGIEVRDLDGADRRRPEEPVGDVAPGEAGVLTLPHAAACRAHVEDVGVADHAADRGDAPTAVRPEAAPVERLRGQELFVERVLRAARRRATEDEGERTEQRRANETSGRHGQALRRSRAHGSRAARMRRPGCHRQIRRCRPSEDRRGGSL